MLACSGCEVAAVSGWEAAFAAAVVAAGESELSVAETVKVAAAAAGPLGLLGEDTADATDATVGLTARKRGDTGGCGGGTPAKRIDGAAAPSRLAALRGEALETMFAAIGAVGTDAILQN